MSPSAAFESKAFNPFVAAHETLSYREGHDTGKVGHYPDMEIVIGRRGWKAELEAAAKSDRPNYYYQMGGPIDLTPRQNTYQLYVDGYLTGLKERIAGHFELSKPVEKTLDEIFASDFRAFIFNGAMRGCRPSHLAEVGNRAFKPERVDLQSPDQKIAYQLGWSIAQLLFDPTRKFSDLSYVPLEDRAWDKATKKLREAQNLK